MRSIPLPKLQIETDRQAKCWLVYVGGICAAVFLATLPLPRVDNHLVGSDGVRYYAITRSVLLDRDFDFTNDYRLLGIQAGLTTTGLPSNQHGIGTAILWMPFFLLAHAISLLLNAFGRSVPTNGMSYIYEASVCLGTIAYATLGFILTYHTIRKLPTSAIGPTFWSVIGMWWATPAIYYLIAEPSMSHALTICTMALFLFTWYALSPNCSMWDWMKLGLATGLVALVRWQDGIIALVPLAELCWWVFQRRLRIGHAIGRLAVFSVPVLLVFSPQFLMWKALYGAFLAIPQGNDFFSWTHPQILRTLFSTRHGLLSWHPVFLLALLGLLPLWKRSRLITLVVLYVFVGELYINSAASRWWADDAFGGRRFVSLIPLLTVPLTALLARMKREWTLILLAGLIVWNGLSLVQYRLRFVSMSEPLTIREMTIGRLLVPFELAQRLLR